MLVTRKSMATGKEHTMDLPVTQEQLDRYATGTVLLQDAFPGLPAPYVEFIKTGITPVEWEMEIVDEEDIQDGTVQCRVCKSMQCADSHFCDQCGNPLKLTDL